MDKRVFNKILKEYFLGHLELSISLSAFQHNLVIRSQQLFELLLKAG
jgi:hypothetical protein